eukprot:TRINITY_DN26616_c0_g1_i2.p1 TRINITY_DN26616_c0_g1~~TRINITY_DN26616_c0_g1_i2.p1  ORF type:complete len:709 (+),score=127.46 TRINITY_DN26616_c0_g1_i2:115-2241(+)
MHSPSGRSQDQRRSNFVRQESVESILAVRAPPNSPAPGRQPGPSVGRAQQEVRDKNSLHRLSLVVAQASAVAAQRRRPSGWHEQQQDVQAAQGRLPRPSCGSDASTANASQRRLPRPSVSGPGRAAGSPPPATPSRQKGVVRSASSPSPPALARTGTKATSASSSSSSRGSPRPSRGLLSSEAAAVFREPAKGMLRGGPSRVPPGPAVRQERSASPPQPRPKAKAAAARPVPGAAVAARCRQSPAAATASRAGASCSSQQPQQQQQDSSPVMGHGGSGTRPWRPSANSPLRNSIGAGRKQSPLRRYLPSSAPVTPPPAAAAEAQAEAEARHLQPAPAGLLQQRPHRLPSPVPGRREEPHESRQEDLAVLQEVLRVGIPLKEVAPCQEETSPPSCGRPEEHALAEMGSPRGADSSMARSSPGTGGLQSPEEDASCAEPQAEPEALLEGQSCANTPKSERDAQASAPSASPVSSKSRSRSSSPPPAPRLGLLMVRPARRGPLSPSLDGSTLGSMADGEGASGGLEEEEQLQELPLQEISARLAALQALAKREIQMSSSLGGSSLQSLNGSTLSDDQTGLQEALLAATELGLELLQRNRSATSARSMGRPSETSGVRSPGGAGGPAPSSPRGRSMLTATIAELATQPEGEEETTRSSAELVRCRSEPATPCRSLLDSEVRLPMYRRASCSTSVTSKQLNQQSDPEQAPCEE